MSILDKINAQRRLDVQAAEKVSSLQSLKEATSKLDTLLGKPKNLLEHLTCCQQYQRERQKSITRRAGMEELNAGGLIVAAEFKRASPSKGDIAMDIDAANQAQTYARAGAAVVSILTEPKWFKGSLQDMKAVREALTSDDAQATCGNGRAIVLRKDFILTEYQIWEARANGADTVLLIVASLEFMEEVAGERYRHHIVSTFFLRQVFCFVPVDKQFISIHY